jgi:Fe-S-cluster formation regulator IscX/YfhJ
MKDRQSLSWSELESDFSRQHVLNAEILSIGDSLQSVVVSRSELASKLNQSIPDGIEDHTSVMVFPNVSSNRLLMEKPELREAIKELCAFPDEPDKLESVLKVLAAAWIDQPVNHRIPISSIIETASACSPTFFKVDG